MTTAIQKNPELKSSLDRARNRVNQLERIAGKMKDSTDSNIRDQHATLVSAVVDLRTEIGAWENYLNEQE